MRRLDFLLPLALLPLACEHGPRQSADADSDADTDSESGTATETDTDTASDTDTDTDTDTETVTETETETESASDTDTGPACDGASDCDDLEDCTDDDCVGGRCVHDPVAAGTDQGRCDECDGAGGHQPPLDDDLCAVVDCGEDSYAVSLADPTECQLLNRDPIDDARCDSVGTCKTAADCRAVSEVADTLGTCERFAPGTCAGAAPPVVESAPAGTRTGGCDQTSCDGNVAVEAGCNGGGSCVAEFSRIDCGALTCVADAEGARCE